MLPFLIKKGFLGYIELASSADSIFKIFPGKFFPFCIYEKIFSYSFSILYPIKTVFLTFDLYNFLAFANTFFLDIPCIYTEDPSSNSTS